MDNLDSLKSSLQNFRNRLASKQAEKQGYLNTAASIDAIYAQMAEDKKTIKGYRDSVKEFMNEQFDNFKGHLHSEVYKAQMEKLIADYDTVIANLDTNMDRLNNAKADYENKAYNCNGPIGSLQSSINSLVHTIQNWIN